MLVPHSEQVSWERIVLGKVFRWLEGYNPAPSCCIRGRHPIVSESYVTDFNAWIAQTTQLLRESRWSEIDRMHLIEEVEDLGKSERRGIASQLTRLLLHLLKWHYQPQRRSDSWLDSILDARTQIELAIEDSPSLAGYPAEQLEECYHRARRQAAKQTSLEITMFPDACPFGLEQVLAEDWLPEG